VTGSSSSLLIFINSIIGEVLSIKAYANYSSKPLLQNNHHNLLMVDSGY
jgi:hypothetical protein